MAHVFCVRVIDSHTRQTYVYPTADPFHVVPRQDVTQTTDRRSGADEFTTEVQEPSVERE